MTVFSGTWGRKYKPSSKFCADSITSGVLDTINIPMVIEAAYRDGVRVFLEVGPGNSCTRMIDLILGNRPHLARAVHAAKQDATSQVLRTLAHLAAEKRIPVNLTALYGNETLCVGHRLPDVAVKREVVIPVGMRPVVILQPEPVPMIVESRETAPLNFATIQARTVEQGRGEVQTANVRAHETYLRLHSNLTQTTQHLLTLQAALLGRGGMKAEVIAHAHGRLTPRRSPESPRRSDGVPRSLRFRAVLRLRRRQDRRRALGREFAEVDSAFPTASACRTSR